MSLRGHLQQELRGKVGKERGLSEEDIRMEGGREKKKASEHAEELLHLQLLLSVMTEAVASPPEQRCQLCMTRAC